MKRLILSVALSAMLAACGSSPTKEQEGAAVEDRSGATASSQQQKPQTQPTGPTSKPLEPSSMSGNPLKDPSNILSKRSVYFELDSNVVKEEFKPVVAAHARYLQQNRGVKMTVQGNADERGSREYNLALGQKRAEAVKKALQLFGVREDQLESVSLGEEKPACGDAIEDCWARNRRGDMLYSGEF